MSSDYIFTLFPVLYPVFFHEGLVRINYAKWWNRQPYFLLLQVFLCWIYIFQWYWFYLPLVLKYKLRKIVPCIITVLSVQYHLLFCPEIFKYLILIHYEFLGSTSAWCFIVIFIGIFFWAECFFCLTLPLMEILSITSAFIFTYFLSRSLFWYPNDFQYLPILKNGDLDSTSTGYSNFVCSRLSFWKECWLSLALFISKNWVHLFPILWFVLLT